MGSTHGESRVTRASAWEGAQYVPLVARANALWAELAAVTKQHYRDDTGGLFIGHAHEYHVAGSRASADTTGLPYTMYDRAEMKRRWPELVVPEGMVGFYDPGAGVLHPERIVRDQLAMSAELGARLMFDTQMLDFGPHGSGVFVRTASETLHADALVLCAGAWMPEILAPLGIALTVERTSLHWFSERAEAPPRETPVLLVSDGHGHATAAFPTLDGRIKGAGHGSANFTKADDIDRTVREADLAPVASILRAYLPQHIGAHDSSAVCMYTKTPSGHFILDRHPQHAQIVIGSACNGFGFKFSSASGEVLAALARGTTASVDPTPWRLPQNYLRADGSRATARETPTAPHSG